jgi:hypothetical protein
MSPIASIFMRISFKEVSPVIKSLLSSLD